MTLLTKKIRGASQNLMRAALALITRSVSSGGPLSKLYSEDLFDALIYGVGYSRIKKREGVFRHIALPYYIREREESMFIPMSALWGDLKEGDKVRHKVDSGWIATLKSGCLKWDNTGEAVSQSCMMECAWKKVEPKKTYKIGDWFQGTSGKLYSLASSEGAIVRLVSSGGYSYGPAVRVANIYSITEAEYMGITGGLGKWFTPVEVEIKRR